MKYIVIFLVSFSLSFSMILDDKDFGKEVVAGKSTTKEYTLKNNSELKKEYFFFTDSVKVKVEPKGFKLKPFEERKFKITVTDNIIVKHDYYLEIKEIIREKPKGNFVNLNKFFRIKQHYKVKDR